VPLLLRVCMRGAKEEEEEGEEEEDEEKVLKNC
jgi:hypothetical protein